jgi:hypothetical protein
MPGWFDFINGQTLPASRVQEFLMDQSVMKFADSGSRAAALPFPTDGMVSYLTDVDRLFVYRSSSSAWVEVVESTNLAALSAALPTRSNSILNSAFDIWQRGTSFAHTSGNIYGADRWGCYRAAFATGATSSRQSPGLTGFQYSARVQRDSGNSSTAAIRFTQAFETSDSIRFAGQTVTLSFYARKGANYTDTASNLNAVVFSGTGTNQNPWGGFTGASNAINSNAVLSNSWTRYSFSGTVNSNANQLCIEFSYIPVGTAGANDWFEITGVQLEAGSVATPFVRAGGTLQGELAACQRYYQRFTADNGVFIGGHGGSVTGTIGQATIPLPVTMRANPSSIDFANISWYNYGNGVLYNTGSFVLQAGQTNYPLVRYTHGSSVFTAGQVGVFSSNATGGFLGFSAEL